MPSLTDGIDVDSIGRNIFQFFHFLSRDNHVDEVLKSIAIVVVVDDDDVYDDGDKNSARIS